MNKEEFEKLIKDQPEEIQTNATLLLNAMVICRGNYKSTPTAVNRREWEDAQAAFKKYIVQISSPEAEPSDTPLVTLAEVLGYLQDSDWKVTKTSLHRHHKEGKILPLQDGTYSIKNVEKYARTWLKQKSTGKRVSKTMDDLLDLQRQKAALEVEDLEIKKKRNQLALEREQNKFIRREQMDIELATRAGVLIAGLKHWVKSHTPEWIQIVEGNMQRRGELMNKMDGQLDKHINSYTASETEVVIDPIEEVAEADQEIEDQ